MFNRRRFFGLVAATILPRLALSGLKPIDPSPFRGNVAFIDVGPNCFLMLPDGWTLQQVIPFLPAKIAETVKRQQDLNSQIAALKLRCERIARRSSPPAAVRSQRFPSEPE